MISLVDININEACLHSSLWSISTEQLAPVSLVRLKMLHRTMISATSYISTLLQTPESLLDQLALGSWCGWFYAYVVICKLVFLQENEMLGHTQVDDMQGEIDNLMPHDPAPDNLVGQHARNKNSTRHDTVAKYLQGWSALAVFQEYNLHELLENFTNKLRFVLPENSIPWRRPEEERESLYKIACLNQLMQQGFNKRIEQLDRLSSSFDANDLSTGQPAAAPSATSQGCSSTGPWQPPQFSSDCTTVPPVGPTVLPFANFMNFDSINFDGVHLPASNFPAQGGQEMFGDWMWNMVMDDFTMPTF
jgi:hypothetical protein